MKKKDLLKPVSLTVQVCSHSSMKLSSPLSYIKKIKITLKAREEPRLNLYKNLFYSLLLFSLLPSGIAVFIR